MIDYLVSRIEALAGSQPDKTALIFRKEKLTYRELYEKMTGIAAFLEEEKIGKGSRVCFSAVSRPEAAAVYLGIQLYGAIAVPADKNASAENLASLYELSESELLLSAKPVKEDIRVCSLKEVYQKAEKQEYTFIKPDGEEIAEILFTSGTTGKPKGVMLSYRAVYHILSNTIEGTGIREDEIVLLPLPLHHSFALRVLRAVLYKGGTVVLQNGFTFAKEAENNITEHHCTAMACVPASYEVMKNQMQNVFAPVMRKLRYIEFGAGSLSVRQRREITEMLPDTLIFNTWGSSESGGAVFCNVSEVVHDEKTIGALGRPLPGKVRMQVLDEDGNVMNSDKLHPGRMVLQGDMQMSGYWKDPENTADALRNGWLWTSDQVYLEKGYVYMLGRADDIINVGGEKVSPLEIENTAGQYEYIRDCACIGAADPEGITGQIPVLFVVTKAGYKEEELQKYLAAKMDRYKLPKQYIALEQIPRNRMQKIDRRELRSIYENKDQISLINPVMQAILSRHSVRRFTAEDIPENILQMILKAGYHAPTDHNMQSWRFTVLVKKEDIELLKEKTAAAAAADNVYFYGFENPKAVVLVSNDERNASGCQDASCAAENMMIAAASYGVGSVWLNPLRTLRHAEPVSSFLDDCGIPENHIVWAMIALGYPASDVGSPQRRSDVVHIIR